MSDQMEAMEALRKADPETLLRALDGCDGWAIFPPESLIKLGLPKAVARFLTHEYHSDGTTKGSITSLTGVPVDCIVGVSGLDLLHFAISTFDLEGRCRNVFGRGRQAREYVRALREYLGGDQ